MTRKSQLLQGTASSPDGDQFTADLFANGRLAFAPAEAARRLGVGRTFLYDALSDGTLKSVKIGSRRLITLQAIQDWLSAHQQSQISAKRERNK